MRAQEGVDRSGNYAVKVTISKDDPLAKYLRYLAERAAHQSEDLTGFVEAKAPDQDKAHELIDLLTRQLPADIRDRLAQKTVEAKARVEERLRQEMSGLPLRGH